MVCDLDVKLPATTLYAAAMVDDDTTFQLRMDRYGPELLSGLEGAYGDRAGEFEQRLNGASYEEIARSGGGIASTVKATRAAGEAAPREDVADAPHRRFEVGRRGGLAVAREGHVAQRARALGVPRHEPVAVHHGPAGERGLDGVLRALAVGKAVVAAVGKALAVLGGLRDRLKRLGDEGNVVEL